MLRIFLCSLIVSHYGIRESGSADEMAKTGGKYSGERGSSEVEGDCHSRDSKILNLTWQSFLLSPLTSITKNSQGANERTFDGGVSSRLPYF